MACSMCEAHVNNVINKYFKVKKVKSSHKDGITTIICDDVLDQSLLCKYINDTDYKYEAKTHMLAYGM